MKTLSYFFVIAILVIAGCATDDTLFETQDDLELKKAKVPIPFKADLFLSPDYESDFILIEGLDPNDPSSYTISRLFCSGTATHMGKLDPVKSYYTLDKLVFFMENGQPFTLNTGTGIIVGANGDSMEFTFEMKQSAIDGSFSGTNEIIPGSGTGRFKGCTGTINTVGGWPEEGPGAWSINEGYLVFE